MTQRPTAGRAPRRTAFTLIELLVVIAIIALLISILMPMLGRAKEMARAVSCQMNLRNQGSALATYAGEYGGHVPFIPGWRAVGTGLDGPSFEYLLAPYLGGANRRPDWNPPTSGGQYVDVHWGLDNTWNKVFFCPAAPIEGKRGWGLWYDEGGDVWGQSDGYQGAWYHHHFSTWDGGAVDNVAALNTGDDSLFPAAARLTREHFSRAQRTPERYCDNQKFATSVGGPINANDLYNQHDSWHYRGSDWARPTLFVDGHVQVLRDLLATAGSRFEPTANTNYLRRGEYSGYHLGSGGGDPPHKPWDYWLIRLN